jgi:hypothetical protein
LVYDSAVDVNSRIFASAFSLFLFSVSLQKTATEQQTQLQEQNKKTEELLSQYKKVNDRLEYLYPKRVDRLVWDEKKQFSELYEEYNKTVDEYIERETNWERRKQESEKEGSPDKGKKFFTQVKTQTEEEFIKEALETEPKRKKEES